jgi:hypothetical protein
MGLVKRGLAEHDDEGVVRAMQLSLYEIERWKQKREELSDVELDENGRYVVRSLIGLQKLGDFIARSQLVPKRWQQKPIDCAVGAQMAMRMGVDVLTFLQNAYLVRGTPGVEGKFLIALINASDLVADLIDYEITGEGENFSCRAFVKLRSGSVAYGPVVDMNTVRSEGWDKAKPIYDGDKKVGEQKSKWATMPDLMFRYRAAAFLARTKFPQLIFGLQTKEEIEDVHGVSLDESERPKLQSVQASEVQVVTASQQMRVVIPEGPTQTDEQQSESASTEQKPSEVQHEQQQEEQHEQQHEQQHTDAAPVNTQPVEQPSVVAGEAESANKVLDGGLPRKFRDRINIARTPEGLNRLAMEISDRRAELTGDVFEELCELIESRQFELNRTKQQKRL